MKKFNILLIFLFFLINICLLNAESGLKLVFYIDPIPLNVINSITQSDNLDKFNYLEQNTPGQISVNLIKKELRKNRLKKISGFLTLYNGYSDFSNTDGQIFFPLEQDEQKIYLVITPNIKLKNIMGQTFSHYELLPSKKEATKIYLFEKQIDVNKQYFWKVSQEELPASNILDKKTVIILTKAKNIYVLTGDFMANDNKQLILPRNIFAINDDGKNSVALNFVPIKKYFEPTEIEEKKLSPLIFEKMLINN
ncbi:MAG: hypothetical protein SZ59_C0005G0045 [candidate division TM6 bacterium GW2011_GWF2_28_16]|nr:MAG: hypothetical protein SZ59_C0005G0045 [candidate division TM6 bacterium GW2011_GWF2_28_16]